MCQCVSNRFAMLHIFYKQLRSGDSTESCWSLWVNLYLEGCIVLVFRPVSNIKKSPNSLSVVSFHN